MIFYLHYILLTSGLSGVGVLLGVYLKAYTDANQGEIGVLLMTFPFVSIIVKPLFCSMADRHQAHKLYLVLALMVLVLGFAPFVVIPFFPAFYTQFPRISWYILVISCHIGLGGLGVAWSLGDSLAVNMAQKTGTPFSRYRLMGTVSWGVYGYIIGQINETPSLPKFVPAFLILHLSVLIEIVIVIFWRKEDFIMYDPSSEDVKSIEPTEQQTVSEKHHLTLADVDSSPSSLGGTLRSRKTASAMHGIFIEDLFGKLRGIEVGEQQEKDQAAARMDNADLRKFRPKIEPPTNKLSSKIDLESDHPENIVECKTKSSQVVLFKMILAEDGRLIKYLCLFTLFGILLAPMNFVFLSIDDVCKERGCNFSQLAGAVLISQASIETLSFLITPWFLLQVGRSNALAFGLLILSMRYFFYTGFYYTANISPYWALVSEWGHGMAYGIVCTILADIALMFANQSQFFIPELRQMGLLSEFVKGNEEKVRAEENSIKMALKATMQAVFGGFMDGLGSGTGSLVCGLIADAYSYIDLWRIFTILSVSVLIVYQTAELTKSKWSDAYQPKEGTKAFHILHANAHGLKGNASQMKSKQASVQV